MIKKDRGITLISLSIAVIIILTITGMILYSAKDSIYIKNLTNMQNDIANLRDKVSLYYSEYGEIPAKTEYPDISKLQSAGVIGANDTGKFLILELENLEGLTLNYGEDYERYKVGDYTNLTDLTDIYIINENSNNIFYVEGIRVTQNSETQIYYTDYTEGDKQTVEVKEVQNWHEETNESGDIVITNGIIELKIGDYVNYDPTNGGTITTTYTSPQGTYHSYQSVAIADTNENMTKGNGYADQTFSVSANTNGWRVLGIDEDTDEILLVSADIVQTTDNGNFYLRGQTGAEWGVKELNDICAIYGEGNGASGARSINADDINKITGYNPETAQYGDGQIYEYGNEVTYTKNASNISYQDTLNNRSGTYGNSSTIFRYYDEGSSIWKTLTTGESKTVTSTAYYYYSNTLTTSSSGETVGISTDSTEYEMLFQRTSSGQPYWLASPCTRTDSGDANFGLRYVLYGGVFNISFFYSDGVTYNPNYYVRPVVSLESDIAISGGEGIDGSTQEKAWQIQ